MADGMCENGNEEGIRKATKFAALRKDILNPSGRWIHHDIPRLLALAILA